jgi:transcriptional regulator with XRE-family HTH domain
MELCALVGLNIRRHRLAAGMTQEELAFRAGMDRTYLSDIERGRRNPTLLTMQDVATPLNLCVVDLLEGSDAIEPPKEPSRPRAARNG